MPLQRTCPPTLGCGRTLPLTDEHWHRNRTNALGWHGYCKDCANKQRRAVARIYDYGEEKKARGRARNKALVRLSKLCPELFADLFAEELANEGLEYRPPVEDARRNQGARR